jgi:isopentenyl diphosphate isomerase/L-lactate dehydrogenase-like FMN-dependent dehydrogenase
MNTNTTTTRRFARYFALPIVSAAMIGGAALGLAGVASAATEVREPNIVATPSVTANPAPEAVPGWHWHHGIYHLHTSQQGYHR